MNSPKLSIITINYNDVEGLEKTMDSVFGQSFKDFEYIIIDGGSTDDSVQQIERHSSRIKHWVSEKDQGVFNAQNKGIQAAKGEYLLFLNSGDVLDHDKALEEFVSHKDFQGDIIYGDYRFEDGQKVYADELTPYYFVKTSLPHQSTLFKRTVFDTMGLYDEKYRIAADRAFFIKCFMSGKVSFQHIKYPLTLFDLSGLSNDPNFLEKKKEEDEALFKEYLGSEYEKVMAQREAEHKAYLSRRNSLPGIWKRIRKRLSL